MINVIFFWLGSGNILHYNVISKFIITFPLCKKKVILL